MKAKCAWLAACLLLSGCACAANAEEDARRTLAEELLTEMDMPGTLQQTTDMLKKMIPMQIKQMQTAMAAESGEEADEARAAERTKKAETLSAKALDMVTKELGWKNVKNDYISLYAKTFTEQELKDAIVFYKSPTGRAFVKKQPELMKESVDLNQKRLYKLIPKLQTLCKDGLKDDAKEPKQVAPKLKQVAPQESKDASEDAKK